MARLHDRQDKLTITGYLRMAKNAVMNVVNSDGTESEVDLSELGVLDGLTATTAELNIMDGVTATAAEINANCDVLTEAVTTTNVITAAENGTRFVLNTATAFVSTLPAPAAGLEYWFYIGATVPTTTHTIVTNASANVIEGTISSREVSALVACVAAADTISFVANLAVTGDYAHVWSDGTNWFLNGMCFVQDGMTTTQAS